MVSLSHVLYTISICCLCLLKAIAINAIATEDLRHGRDDEVSDNFQDDTADRQSRDGKAFEMKMSDYPQIVSILSPANLQSLFKTQEDQKDVWVLLIYKDAASCPHSAQARSDFSDVRDRYAEVMKTGKSRQKLAISVGFAELLVQPETMPILQDLKIKSVPTTVLFRATDDGSSVWAVDYKGSMMNMESWFGGLRHYVTRLAYSTIQKRHRHLPRVSSRQLPVEEIPVTDWVSLAYLSFWSIPAMSIDELQEKLADTLPLFWDSRPPELALDPTLSISEAAWVRFVLEEDQDERENKILPIWIACRCKEASPPLIEAWDALTSVLGLHHQMVFCELEECNGDQGIRKNHISLFEFQPDSSQTTRKYSWDPTRSIKESSESSLDEDGASDSGDKKRNEDGSSSPIPKAARAISTQIHRVLSALLLPSVLWFDRQSTVPMAMAPQFPQHAVLVVEYPTNTDSPTSYFDSSQRETKQTISAFRERCQEYRQLQQNHYERLQSGSLPFWTSPLVCLIVPSTETRVLTTFGIDVWSELDEELVRSIQKQATNCQDDQAEKKTSSNNTCDQPEKEKSLPALFFTSRGRKEDGTSRLERIYLDPPLDETRFKEFFDEMWNRETNDKVDSDSMIFPRHVQSRYGSSESKGSMPEPRKNGHFVSEWTANHVINPQRHTLLMIYSPTCAHCKRLNVIWNALGELVQYLNWDSWLEIARLDVSTEEFSGVQVASILASVYYYRESTSGNGGQPVWYDRGEAGSVSDPIEFLDWLLDASALDGESPFDTSLLLGGLEKSLGAKPLIDD